jgi:hypothetical protein
MPAINLTINTFHTIFAYAGEQNKLMSGARHAAAAGSKGHGKEAVGVMTLGQIWPLLEPVRNGADPELILVVDAEGQEARILCCDLPLPLPRLILFEHEHLRGPDRSAISANLKRQGFVWIADLKHQDDLGRRQRPQDRLYGRPRT